MTLLLVIENSPHPQPQREMRWAGGERSIGRGADCDWQIDDPDMFISRRHCILSESGGRWTLTDASRGGVYVDGSTSALGAGVSVVVETGMRFRMGDVVIRAEIEGTDRRTSAAAARDTSRFAADDFFSRAQPAEPPPQRPETLPDPFDYARAAMPAAANVPAAARSAAFDDPFTLDPLPSPPPSASAPAAAQDATAAPSADFGFSDFFTDATPPAAESPAADPAAPASSPAPFVAAAQPTPVATPAAPMADPLSTPAPVPAAPEASLAPEAARQAFYRGLGVAPPPSGGDPEAEIEALGRRFRLLADGLVMLLRARAREKNSVRVAQTVIGSADVNPLKFSATSDEAVGALVAPRGKGYLDPEAAISAGFRDLSDHQLRTWAGLQSALRRMIDRFDPKSFESEADAAGLMKALLSGGRNARLWQLYTDRYRDIAKSAEDRFLGDVGADFRAAYERNKEDDR